MFKGGLWMLGCTVAGAGLTMLAEASTLGDDTNIKMGMAGGICVAVFYAGMTFKGMKDDIKTMKADIREIKAHCVHCTPVTTPQPEEPE